MRVYTFKYFSKYDVISDDVISNNFKKYSDDKTQTNLQKTIRLFLLGQFYKNTRLVFAQNLRTKPALAGSDKKLGTKEKE